MREIAERITDAVDAVVLLMVPRVNMAENQFFHAVFFSKFPNAFTSHHGIEEILGRIVFNLDKMG